MAVVLPVLANPSHALDARHPDPLSVVAAAFAAQNVGNIDAAAAFYTDDAAITNTRGKAAPMRHFHEANRLRTCSSARAQSDGRWQLKD